MPNLLLKLSGEAMGGGATGIDPGALQRFAGDVKALVAEGVGLALVLGGGNLFRGEKLAASGMDRVMGDRIGMLATVMNGLAFGDFLARGGVPNKVFSSIPIAGVADGYNRDEARRIMRAGEVAILTGGTGNPYFTTDTAACLRGIELGVDAVLKATNVDGVYDADPKLEPTAKKFDTITYDEVLSRELGVMDLTAIVLCREQQMPLVVFDMHRDGALLAVARGEPEGTRVVA